MFQEGLIIRAYIAYCKQIAYNINIHDAVMNNPNFERYLIDYFHQRFDPKRRGEHFQVDFITRINTITHEDHRNAIMLLWQVMSATVRTNYYLSEKSEALSLKIKLRDSDIKMLPRPIPFAEIFVYNDDIEAIHLRNAAISRGGIRWSDRKEDYRTEVLGLLKAQNVKNSIIVPDGAKGAFYIKTEKSNQHEHVINCYKQFISSMLDITDNMVESEIKRHDDIVSYDNDDPYLVVAADKGTSTFSDYANELSKKYNFWLKDAFASGGSNGYNHKMLGITARGAWESAKRHFKERSININKPFTAIGIGGLNGDVFGNGVIQYPTMRLLAAFDHKHIFIDPNPNIEKSYAERVRIFNLNSLQSWDIYDQSIISRGGGIFSRTEKFINITQEMRILMHSLPDQASISPDELIKAILQTKVDLLWNGGIGTFIKAQHETHEQVQDSLNNNIRIDGKDVYAKVIAEGGNIGITPFGRIEMELMSSCRLYTDAIDNSGGVDCSDHEVNMKIAIDSSKNISDDERNKILSQLEPEVVKSVLKHNFVQTQGISIEKYRFVNNNRMIVMMAHIDALEHNKILDKSVTILPTYEQVSKRMEEYMTALTRSEISSIVSHSKIHIASNILNNALIVLDDKIQNQALDTYFPTLLKSTLKEHIQKHILKKQIFATTVSSEIVDRVGMYSVTQMASMYLSSTYPILNNAKIKEYVQNADTFNLMTAIFIKLYILMVEKFDLRTIWSYLDELENVYDKKDDIMAIYNLRNDIAEAVIYGIRRSIDNQSDLHNVQEYRIADLSPMAIPKHVLEYLGYIENNNAKIDNDLINKINEQYQNIHDKIKALMHFGSHNLMCRIIEY